MIWFRLISPFLHPSAFDITIRGSLHERRPLPVYYLGRVQAMRVYLSTLLSLCVVLISCQVKKSVSVKAVSSSTSSLRESTAPPNEGSMSASKPSATENLKDLAGNIDIVFSDVDGTLVHYPTDVEAVLKQASEKTTGGPLLALPPSATGKRGIISHKTLFLCQELRRKTKTKLVLISGMRTSTLLKRLPFLPKADAYCTEAGGRIFRLCNDKDTRGFKVIPMPYDGATPNSMEPFYIVEDVEWRKRMEDVNAAGKDGFVGNEIVQNDNAEPIPPSLRNGALWNYASQVQDRGYVIDTKGYAACFRVNREQQPSSIGDNEFHALARDDNLPSELARSINLGCLDIYPCGSGKKNCCRYLAETLCPLRDGDDILAQRCVCLCDDDNDLEMALACAHAFIPSISSESMVDTIRNNAGHFTQTFSKGDEVDQVVKMEGSAATDHALSLIYDLVS